METKPLTNAEYVSSPVCPECRSDDLNYSIDMYFGGDFVTQGVSCNKCGHNFVSVYTLTGYDNE